MKKINRALAVLGLLLAAVPVMAQWTTSGSNIYNSNTGNVGIGITSPSEKLTIDGSIRFGTTSKVTMMASTDGTNTNLYLLNPQYGSAFFNATRFGGTTYSASNQFIDLTGNGVRIQSYYVAEAATGALDINTDQAITGAGLRLLTIKNQGVLKSYVDKDGGAFFNGNVGVGTTTPTEKMHLAGTNPMLFVEGDANSYYGGIRIKSMAGDGLLGNYGSSVYWGLNMSVKQPSTNLVSELGVTITGAVAHSFEPTAVAMKVVSPPSPQSDIFRVAKDISTTPGSISESAVFSINKDGNADLTGKMKIAATNFPATGNYKLAVGGDIIAEKVKVKLQSSGWPDYVFFKGYELPSLRETEQYIQQNKHLPGVPSASTIEKEGLDLGDGQSVLLKKIEELTLHMIEMNKRVEKLEKENQELKKAGRK